MSFMVLGLVTSPILFQIFVQTDELDVITNEHQTCSGDLLNNPFIQELIKKIEQSKIQIGKLQEQAYEQTVTC